MKLLKNERQYRGWSKTVGGLPNKTIEYPCWGKVFWEVSGTFALYLYRSDLERMLKEMK
jgi:hypothetical protein